MMSGMELMWNIIIQIKKKNVFTKMESWMACKIYYPDGKIMEENAYRNDTRDGISRWFDTAGKVTIEYEYRSVKK